MQPFFKKEGRKEKEKWEEMKMKEDKIKMEEKRGR